MTMLLGMALTNAVLAALLAALAWAVGRAFPARPALAYGLWLLVLLKLITPPLVQPGLQWASPPVAIAEAETVAECPTAVIAVEEVPERFASAPASPSWPMWLVGAWAAGAVGLWLMAARRLLRLHRLLGLLPPVPGDVQDEIAGLAQRLGLRQAPRGLFAPAACRLPPLVVALAGRSVVLPIDLWQALTPAQRRTLLLHELAHLRRGDHATRWLELLVLGLHWWNPVAWLAVARLRHAEELCCDAWVVWADPDHAADYAAALVETAAYLSCSPPRLPGVSAAAPVVDLRRRLVMILSVKTSRRLSLAAVVGVVLLGAAVLPLAPTLTASDPVSRPAATAKMPPSSDPNRLIAEMKSCQVCHQGTKQPEKKADDLHAEVVRLMQVVDQQKSTLAMQQAALKKAQDQLAEALAKFERTNPPAKTRTETRKVQKPVGDQLQQLEKKIQDLLREVEEMRKERQRGMDMRR